MKILTSCNDFLTKNRKNILYVIGFIFVFFILSDFSFAENTNVSDTNPDNKNFWISLLNGILKNLAALLGLLTFLVGLFLAPEWTSGSIVWLGWSGWALKQMWIMMSNVVYFIFAMIFIWIAFMNIIGQDADTYGLKSAMPRFIVGVLIVPFTWFLVQFILSISSILTVWVLSLPYDTFKDTYMKDEDLKKVTFCKDWVIYTGTQPKDKKIMECKDTSSTINLKDIVNPEKSESLFGIMSIYTYGVMSIDGNGKVYSENLVVNGLGNLFDLWIKVLFDLVFVVVYFILMIALALALFVRGVYLWFYAMLSPVFWLLYFFKKQNDGMGDAGKKFNLKEFIALAFVPVYVSAALAFWLLFIFAAGNSWWKQSTGIISEDGKEVKHAWMSYTIEWPSTNDGDAKSSIKKVFTWFQWTFGTLILQVFWLAILWIAVMAALKQSSITQNVIDPFDKFGDSIWQLAMKAPTYAPIIPTGSGMMSAQGLSTAWQSFSSAVHNEYTWKWSKVWSEIAKNMWFWNQALSDIKEILSKKYDTDLDKRKWMNDLLSKIDSTQLWDSGYRSELAKAFKHLWATADLETAIKVEWTNKEQLARILDQKWEEKWWDAWQKWAGWLFVWKSSEQIASMIWRWWGSESTQTTSDTPLPTTIRQKEWDKNTFNIYWTDKDWKVTDKVEHTLKVDGVDGWKTNTTNAIQALSSFKGKTKAEFRKLLSDIWIKDDKIQTEIINWLDKDDFFKKS